LTAFSGEQGNGGTVFPPWSLGAELWRQVGLSIIQCCGAGRGAVKDPFPLTLSLSPRRGIRLPEDEGKMVQRREPVFGSKLVFGVSLKNRLNCLAMSFALNQVPDPQERTLAV
jgi:hypothetical protein